MSQYDDFKGDLQSWVDMWDTAQTKNEFKPRQGFQPTELADEMSKDDSDAYFSYLNDIIDTGPEEVVLQEEKSQNPVYPDSAGPDNQKPDPVWLNDKLLKEVESLKKQLHELENKLAAKDCGSGKKWPKKPIEMDINLDGKERKKNPKVESLRSRIDKMSSKLGVDNEPSPWRTAPKND